MAYCTRSDIEDVYGIENVKKWADLDSNGDSERIAARILRSISFADDRIDNSLRDGLYAVPFASPVPTTIARLSAEIAGLWLYEARGAEDVDEVTGIPRHRYRHRSQEISRELRKIQAGQIRLNATTVRLVPEVIEDED